MNRRDAETQSCTANHANHANARGGASVPASRTLDMNWKN